MADGYNLTNGDFVTGKNFKNIPLPISFGATRVYASSETIAGSVSFGLTDNLDIGVAVPWVRMALGVDVGLFSASGTDFTPGGRAFLMPPASAAGIGDIAIFGRYQLWHLDEGGVSADVEMRLPSGDTDNLRGLGVTRTLASAVWSERIGVLGPHANVGNVLVIEGAAFRDREMSTPRIKRRTRSGSNFSLTCGRPVSLDIIGRHLLHGGQLGYQTLSFGPGTVDGLVPVPGGISILSFAPGVKWNASAGNVLVDTSLLTTLKNDGLRANMVPVVGLEWAF